MSKRSLSDIILCSLISFNDELKQKRKWVSSFLKKLWCCVGGRVKQELVLSNKLIKV